LFMSRSPEKQARAEAMLGELAEISLMVAKELAVQLRESEDVGETVELAAAFQKVSRVVRLTLALDFKLERDAARDAQAEAREAEKAEAQAAERRRVEAILSPSPRRGPQPAETRKDRVHNLLTRLLWNECEGSSGMSAKATAKNTKSCWTTSPPAWTKPPAARISKPPPSRPWPGASPPTWASPASLRSASASRRR
jgi:hypothetical protein